MTARFAKASWEVARVAPAASCQIRSEALRYSAAVRVSVMASPNTVSPERRGIADRRLGASRVRVQQQFRAMSD